MIGLGVSTEQTKRRAEELAEHGIPMVGALLTAEKLNYDKIKGFGSLEHRSCMHRTLSILTAGTDLGAILEEREQELREANLTIVFAGTVDAEGRGRNVPGTPEHYDDFLSAFQQQGFSAGQLGDGGAIMMHDALLTATKTVRLAAPRGAASSPTADDVRGQLLNLNGNFEVPGAGGGMSFSADSPGAGNPQDSPDCRLTETGEAIGKPMPVLQYPQSAGDSSRQVGPLYCVPT